MQEKRLQATKHRCKQCWTLNVLQHPTSMSIGFLIYRFALDIKKKKSLRQAVRLHLLSSCVTIVIAITVRLMFWVKQLVTFAH